MAGRLPRFASETWASTISLMPSSLTASRRSCRTRTASLGPHPLAAAFPVTNRPVASRSASPFRTAGNGPESSGMVVLPWGRAEPTHQRSRGGRECVRVSATQRGTTGFSRGIVEGFESPPAHWLFRHTPAGTGINPPSSTSCDSCCRWVPLRAAMNFVRFRARAPSVGSPAVLGK